MIFNEHSDLKGRHAVLSPSQSSWLRYPPEKVRDLAHSRFRTILGTELHDYADGQICLQNKQSSKRGLIKDIKTYIYSKYKALDQKDYGLKLAHEIAYLPDYVFDTVYAYINDCIGFAMRPEQILVYSDCCFGTTDAISYRNNFLRVHDLKTGEHPAAMEQLEVYAALFCLEYKVDPAVTQFELRIYQGGDALIHTPESQDILALTEIIRLDSKIVSEEMEK